MNTIEFDARGIGWRIAGRARPRDGEEPIDAAIRSLCRRITRERRRKVEWLSGGTRSSADANGTIVDHERLSGGGRSVVYSDVRIWIDTK